MLPSLTLIIGDGHTLYSERLPVGGSERRGRNEIKKVLVDEVGALHLLD
jgi:hypothetical protein